MKMERSEFAVARASLTELLSEKGSIEIYEHGKRVGVILDPQIFERLTLCSDIVEFEFGERPIRPIDEKDVFTYEELLDNI